MDKQYPKTVKLISTDGRVFTVEIVVIAKMSMMIGAMLADLVYFEDTWDGEIPIPEVHGEILEKMIQWCERNYPGDGDDQANEQLAEWNRSFLDVENEVLYAFTRAADYLDIKDLYQLCNKKVTAQINNIFDKCGATFRISYLRQARKY